MSRLLVSAQLLLIILLAFPFHTAQLSVLPIGLLTLGMLVAIAAIKAMPYSSFSVMPEPKSGGELVTHLWTRLPSFQKLPPCSNWWDSGV